MAFADDDDDYGLTLKDVRRLIRMLRWYESLPLNALSGTTPPRVTWTAKFFTVTTEIPAGSGATPGKGAGTMMAFNPTTGTVSSILGANGYTGISLYSFADVSVVVGAIVQCVVVDNCYFLDLTACANTSGASSGGSGTNGTGTGS